MVSVPFDPRKHFVEGYRRDPSYKRRQHDVRLMLAGYGSTAVPDTYSLRPYECPLLNQGQTGSCGAAGTAQGLSVACNVAGQPLGFVPSPDGIYGATRAIERALAHPTGALPRLTDSGVMPADVMEALARFGVRPMLGPTPDGRNYDLSSSADLANAPPLDATKEKYSPNVNDEPRLEELELSGAKLIAGEYRLNEQDPNLLQLVKQSIFVAKAPVGDGTFVDSQVMDYARSSAPVGAPNLSDPNGGGHWTGIVGYRLEADGSTSLEVVNSWGEEYGDAGHFWAQESWLKACTDLYSWTVRRPV